MPVPITWAKASILGGAQVVGDEAFGEAVGDDVGHRLAEQLVAAVAELLLGLHVEQHDVARLVDHDHGVRRRFQQAAVAASSGSELLGRLADADVADGRGHEDPVGALERAEHDLDRELAAVLAQRDQLDARPDLLRQGVGSAERRSSATSRSANPSGMMLVTGWPRSSSRR